MIIPFSIIIIHLVGALILGKQKIANAKLFSKIIFAVSAVLSFVMFKQALDATILFRYGSDPILNISLSVDALAAFLSILFTVVGLLVIKAADSMIDFDVKENDIPKYYALVTGLVGALCGIVFFDNLLNTYIFIEITSFLAAFIVMIKKSPENYKAGMKYLGLSILASTFLILGIILMYNQVNSLIIPEMGQRIAEINNQGLLGLAFYAILIGVAFKAALFPFHIWLPDAHGSAPATSSAILSALVLKGYIIVFIKIILIVFGVEVVASLEGFAVLSVLGAVAMIFGSFYALVQKDIKRMIAYSSVAQIGYIFLGIGIGTQLGFSAAVYHILTHAVTKSCLFLLAGSIYKQTHTKEMDQLGGLGRLMPLTYGLFTICALSMIGFPPLVGFSSKWNFVQAILDTGSYWMIVVLTISTLLNAAYYLPVVIQGFFGDNKNYKAKSLERPVKESAPMIILAILVLALGVFGSPAYNLFLEYFAFV